MSEIDLKMWEGLFDQAVALIDTVNKVGERPPKWRFGGGTMLMIDFNHRFSKDIDIFITDPQYLTFYSPRLNDVAEDFSTEYVEAAHYLKIIGKGGDIDFVISPTLTSVPTVEREIRGRMVMTETPVEIVAKKAFYRAQGFTARDLFDMALVLERCPEDCEREAKVLRERAQIITDRLEDQRERLESDFAKIIILDYNPTFEHCYDTVTAFLNEATPEAKPVSHAKPKGPSAGM
ncbi:nucleotidyl transferase AbiEii/AbiGii toxin family protein [Burkholderia cepacia]|uniref:Nucleotidyl transferase AbiEii/AbiGii toxin family protein n=1 Tax=Burkholderia cepacia TaxID=292 RepID=A0AAX2RQT3_BURCE|nr:nucleotidyl transferase AbiEii/AbiGii toxin family protein [Burkholderia cepacia]TES60683.1 nucleotidyl transferase AbiEii/AbiGii toxin family protein [Burkholderia cepacia]TET01642.1 nucleotidyl transferase AbiEii/AbiGii toxin family protein [Burkholderia cepacia]TEU47500.1 nucleotidyl transferase AbiEii/AbiGii toxin family protein [Burkholderia cepacia]TEU53527.1 nucleotidyl transferase AbiEii/AbiGii toxin family protein [Burkholderia cepacia]TEV02133.1 nucleotidyl transferase AbiEii/AbiG